MILRSALAGRNAVHQMTLDASLMHKSRDGAEQAIIAVVTAVQKSLAADLPPMLLAIVSTSQRLSSGIRAAKAPKAQITVQLDVVNPAAVEWANRHAAELIVEITGDTEAAVRALIVRAFEEGIAPLPASRLIRESVGLTERYVQAVLALRQRILDSPGSLQYAGNTPIRVPKSGMSADRLERTLAQYTTRLQNSRARTIARTETMRASNEGQRILWREARNQGLISRRIQQEWITFDPCPEICAPLDGERADLGALFPGGYDGPPAHPNCRCTLGLVN